MNGSQDDFRDSRARTSRSQCRHTRFRTLHKYLCNAFGERVFFISSQWHLTLGLFIGAETIYMNGFYRTRRNLPPPPGSR